MKRFLSFIFFPILLFSCTKQAVSPKTSSVVSVSAPVAPAAPVLPISLTGTWSFISDTLESYNNNALIYFSVDQIPKGSSLQFNDDDTGIGHIAPYPTHSAYTDYNFTYMLEKDQVSLDSVKGYFTITKFVNDTITLRHLVSGSIATNDDIIQIYCLMKQ